MNGAFASNQFDSSGREFTLRLCYACRYIFERRRYPKRAGGAVPALVAGVKNTWKQSLGTRNAVTGAFTCPLNPCSSWSLPGCGRENRARDTKCDSCNRIIRVDWHVG